ncbi:major facilitator superfamily transporter [Aaosphaeria arxii CBS 175.79]|uniref:Major facilitator superfamily transporter n=1 Tax=Aaosphaeria arxii CBS 175.79 TaxID=1450172 RepID=A0A6A5XGJ6_9PLEO|nr:major facilitator superfamily transporter [Aaosphaeria arxii CBS 175.79]KAF2011979.1 major facilitator superfamily transporter [Aaosphaeria arxii CBS 175.79]
MLVNEKPITHNVETVDDVSALPDATASEESIEWTEAEESIVRRKLDLKLVPLCTFLYMLCFIDRANVGNARIQGLAVDLELRGYKFNWALSAFYVTYLIFEIPSNILLKRFGPRIHLPFLVGGFGLVSICTSFVTTFGGLVAARAALGVFEGGTMPGLAFMMSSFYKRTELTLRIGCFISAAGLAGAFGGLLATVLSRIPAWGAPSMIIHTWRNIFFFEGIFTVLTAMLAYFLLANSPGEARFLTTRERQIAVQRLARERVERSTEEVSRQDVKRALTSFHTYLCGFGFLFINITIQGLAVFLPTILADLRWTSTKAQLMTVPPNLAAAIVTISIAYASDKCAIRGPFIIGLSIVGMIGMVVLRWNTEASIRYMGVFFVMCGASPGGPMFLTWGINNAAGPTVQAITSAHIVTLGTFGGIIATWSYLVRDGPLYHTGHTLNFSGMIVVLCIAIMGMCYCYYENKARRSGKRDARLAGLSEAEQDKLGHDHPSFVFLL